MLLPLSKTGMFVVSAYPLSHPVLELHQQGEGLAVLGQMIPLGTGIGKVGALLGNENIVKHHMV